LRQQLGKMTTIKYKMLLLLTKCKYIQILSNNKWGHSIINCNNNIQTNSGHNNHKYILSSTR
jgi:hypothetical protein